MSTPLISSVGAAAGVKVGTAVGVGEGTDVEVDAGVEVGTAVGVGEGADVGVDVAGGADIVSAHPAKTMPATIRALMRGKS